MSFFYHILYLIPYLNLHGIICHTLLWRNIESFRNFYFNHPRFPPFINSNLVLLLYVDVSALNVNRQHLVGSPNYVGAEITGVIPLVLPLLSTEHTFKKSNKNAMSRNWSDQNPNPALKTKTGNN